MESVFPKNTYYDYKVHVLITLKRSYIASFEITSTSTDTRERLRYSATHWSNPAVLAAEGYIILENMRQEMQEKNIYLFTLKRSNSKEN